jgi:Domain of unknown function (DUF4402)
LHGLGRSAPGRRFVSFAALGFAIGYSSCASAAQESLSLTVNSDLRFGSFVVMASGARVVNATGAVSNIGIYPIASGITGPAQFTVTYDRGNNGRKSLDIVIEVSMGSTSTVRSGGVTGTLSAFTTDIAGVPSISTGQIVTLTILGCTTRLCTRTFRIGSRIDVSRSGTGRTIAIPIPMTATLVNVR